MNTRRLLSALTPAVVVLTVLFSVAVYGNEANLLQQAESLRAADKHSEALNFYEKAAAGNPELIEALRGIVESYRALGDAQGAVVFMEALFLENPDSAGASYGLGYALYAARKYERAVDYFEKAIKIKPDMAEAWNNCAAIHHFVTHDYERARSCYERAIELSTAAGKTRVRDIARKNLANLPGPEETRPLKEKLTLEEFVGRFLSRVEEDNDRALGLLVLGQKENAEQALDWLLAEAMSAAAADNPQEEHKAKLLARLLEKHYRRAFGSDALQKILADYERLDTRQKKHIIEGETYVERGFELEQRGDYQEALQHYERALERFDGIDDTGRKATVLMLLGDVYRRVKNPDKARKAYGDALTCFIALRDEQKKAEALSSLGISCSLLGQDREALDFLQRSLALYRQLDDSASAGKVQQNIDILQKRIQQKN